jgi:hypothetical protein
MVVAGSWTLVETGAAGASSSRDMESGRVWDGETIVVRITDGGFAPFASCKSLSESKSR